MHKAGMAKQRHIHWQKKKNWDWLQQKDWQKKKNHGFPNANTDPETYIKTALILK